MSESKKTESESNESESEFKKRIQKIIKEDAELLRELAKERKI